jgi:hypothetical protein
MSCPQCGANDDACRCSPDDGQGADDAMLLQFLQAIQADGRGASSNGLASSSSTPAEYSELVPVGAAAPTLTAQAGPPAPGEEALTRSANAWDPLARPARLGPTAPPAPAPGGPAPSPWAPPGAYVVPPGAYTVPPAQPQFGYPPAYGQPGYPPRHTMSTGAKVGIAVGAVGGALFLILLLLAIAIPTFLSVERGRQWFTGGVPRAWAPATVNNMPRGATLEAAWRTPGPDIQGVFPCLAVIKFDNFSPSQFSISQWLEAIARRISARGEQSQDITLVNGAPALSVSQPGGGGFADGQLAGPVTTSSYAIYAEHAGFFYVVEFVAPSGNFASEEPTVAEVMNNFIGSGSY